jgi:hypothetical protein
MLACKGIIPQLGTPSCTPADGYIMCKSITSIPYEFHVTIPYTGLVPSLSFREIVGDLLRDEEYRQTEKAELHEIVDRLWNSHLNSSLT